MSDIILVIAGTDRQARNFALERELERPRFISHPEQLEGYDRGTRYVRVGTWFERKDLGRIRDVILSRGYVRADMDTGITDKHRMDFLQRLISKGTHGGGVALRRPTQTMGWALYETGQEEAVQGVRDVIDEFIREYDDG